MRFLFRVVCLALVLLGGPSLLSAQTTASQKYGELLKRLPDQANCLMLVDVDGLFDSPMGKREQWREKAANRPNTVMNVGSDVSKFAMAINLDFTTLQERWGLGLAETRTELPDLEALAAREGGFIEKGFDLPAVWTPRGFYLMAFPPKVLAYITDVDRSTLKAWIEKTLAKPRTFPPSFANRAIYRADHGSQVVLALNLADSISAPMLAPWLNTIEAVKKANLDTTLLAERLASAKSAFLQIEIKENIQGAIVIEFEKDVTYSAIVAKEVILTALEEKGASLPELDTWVPKVEPNAITFFGRLSENSLRTLLLLATPPQSSTTTPPAIAAAPSPGETAPAVGPASPGQDFILKTSQAYFHSVVDLLNGLKTVKRPTYASTKLWYDRYALQIEELPILNVDKDLLDWGMSVARTVREMAYGINYSAKNQTYTLANQPNGYGGFSYGGYGYYSVNSKTYDQAIIKRQSEAQLSVALDGTWEGLQTAIADMRRKMTEKYSVEF